MTKALFLSFTPCKYPPKIFLVLAIATALQLCATVQSAAQADSSFKTTDTLHPRLGHQLRLSFDLSRPLINQIQSTHNGYEAAVDYYFKNELYFVLEGGGGSATYDYPDLSYRTNSAFFRLGFDKTLLKRMNRKDWDMVFMGMRYGMSSVQRQEAAYTLLDSVWGSTNGTIPAKDFLAYWLELTGGVKVEVLRNVMLGWNIRARFLLNGRSFTELSPIYIAGFGRGDKTTVFDFNFYVAYTFRWGGSKQ